ncbi:D-alanine--D-alanine ligase family protein [Paenibacillus terrigena]|uniref:D-alanine--D-alanine ligase family protein n=1 Tax=Paenibacillus terrigena TaxID=369333 RepID=UPI000371DBBF|nr:D-alanine--D-alanine ligase family protein [Paenibacillus terrigena]
MERAKVVVLFGGMSTEHQVSLQSAAAVIEHIPHDKYEVMCIGITEEGKWLHYIGGIDQIRDGSWHQHTTCRPASILVDPTRPGILLLDDNGQYEHVHVDCVFPVLHGKNGEDGTVQGLLQLSGIPYVGCDTASSAVSMDKAFTQDLVKSAGIVTTEYMYVTQATYDAKRIDMYIHENFGYPVFVKPSSSGSSVGITKVRDAEALDRAVQYAFTFDRKVIIEKEVRGIEVGCAVYGNEELSTGVIGEIEPSRDFLDYDDKYLLGEIKQHVPARVHPEVLEAVKQRGMEVYRVLGCRGLARVDFFITPAGEIIFNEINSMPGFTASSRYPAMIAAAGLSYSELIDRLIELARES